MSQVHKCNGARFRGRNDLTGVVYDDLIVAPEWGTRFICVACNEAPVSSLHKHQLQDCSDWNAFNRINNGYKRQFNARQAPATQTQPLRLLGEHYRLIRDALILPPWIIMEQAFNWGPYTPLQVPHNAQGQFWWANRTYEACRLHVMAGLPDTMSIPPPPDHRTAALLTAHASDNTASLMHELHKADELNRLCIIAEFMEAHPDLRDQLVLDTVGLDHWNQSAIYLAKNPTTNHNPTANNPPQPIWIPITPPGQGPAGTGAFMHNNVGGVTGKRLQHRAAPGDGDNTSIARVLYDNVPPADVDHFNMVGSPRRRR